MLNRCVTLIIFFILFIAFYFEARADIYKCVSEDGTTEYKTQPCSVQDVEEVIKSQNSPQESPTGIEEPYDITDLIEPEEDAINLEIITNRYKFSRNEMKSINNGVDFLYNYYKQIFDYEGNVEITMRIFGKEKDFFNYQKKHINKVFSTAGIFISRIDEGAVNGSMSRKRVISTLLHECSHAILRKKTSNVPRWINEGLAEYFETMSATNEKIVVDYQKHRYRDLIRWRSEGSLIPLREYVSLNSSAWIEIERQHDEITRTMAWSIIHYLMSTELGQKSLVRLIREFNERRDLKPVQLVNANIEGGLKKLESKWLKYISSPPTIHTYKPFN